MLRPHSMWKLTTRSQQARRTASTIQRAMGPAWSSDPVCPFFSPAFDLSFKLNSLVVASPMSIPETDVDLDAAYSQKIKVCVPDTTVTLCAPVLLTPATPQLAIRQEHFTALRKTLHKVLPTNASSSRSLEAWKRADPKICGADSETKNGVLSSVARELEFAVHSLCRTDTGYSERAEEKLRAVRNLSRAEVWNAAGSRKNKGVAACADLEDLEEAREVVDVIRQVCQRARKGRG